MHAEQTIDDELSGLDNLEVVEDARPSFALRFWSAAWPKVAAISLVLTIWQFAVWREWKKIYVLPSPGMVWERLVDDISTAKLWSAVFATMRRAVFGFLVSIVIGGVIGVAVTASKRVRTAIGSLITGLQTMPSIAWFPLAILVFQKSEAAIVFVVVLGAAPAIANGVIAGAEQVAPLLTRSGTMLGARGLNLYRTVTLPASLPSILGGLKQGWAFAWRSLMAGELLVIIPKFHSIGVRLQNARDLSDAPELMATMILILMIGIVVDSLLFATAERSVRARWGLIDPAQ